MKYEKRTLNVLKRCKVNWVFYLLEFWCYYANCVTSIFDQILFAINCCDEKARTIVVNMFNQNALFPYVFENLTLLR